MSDYTETKVNLIINKISRQKYNELLNANQVNENELYMVDESNLDALSATIINVADPILSSDAANKNYVDNKSTASILWRDWIPPGYEIKIADNCSIPYGVGSISISIDDSDFIRLNSFNPLIGAILSHNANSIKIKDIFTCQITYNMNGASNTITFGNIGQTIELTGDMLITYINYDI